MPPNLSAEIKALKDLLMGEIQGLRKDVNEVLTQYSTTQVVVAELQVNVQDLQQENDELKKENSKMKASLDRLSNRINVVENYERSLNLVFHGIPIQDDKENCLHVVRNIMTTHMNLKQELVNGIEITKCHRLFEKGKKTKKIIMRFLRFSDREAVWSARFKLAGSQYFLNEDFCSETVKRRQILLPIFQEAKKKKLKASLSADRLTIEGKLYTIENLNHLPHELNPAEIATKRSPDVTAFFTAATPLSNFYVTCVEIDNVKYHSVEQYLQLQKAILAEDTQAAAAIRRSSHPAECKRIANNITVDNNEWFPVAKTAIRTACLAKFTQDEYAKNFLLSTGGTTLAEASKDTTWGIGIGLNEKNVLNKPDWQGLNALGTILEDVRKSVSELK